MQPLSDGSSVEGEEAEELRKFAAEVKRKSAAKKLGIHPSQVDPIAPEDLFDEVPNLDDPGSPYMDSDEEYDYGKKSDSELVR